MHVWKIAASAMIVTGVVATGVIASLPAGAAPGDSRTFGVRCAFSHTNSTDAIVMPGMTNMSHQHEFFGNTTTNELTTGATLLAGSTTCDDPNDHSAYWVPALFNNGTRVAPVAMSVKYDSTNAGSTTAFPVGFKAVSGRTNQTAAWGCGAPGSEPVFGADVATVPTCTGEQHLVAQVTFPNCWDGTSVDSANHMSHLVFATQNSAGTLTCPSDHAVAVPKVVLQVHYPHSVVGGAAVTLASGAASTLHGDMFEAWSGASLTNRLRVPRADAPADQRPTPRPADQRPTTGIGGQRPMPMAGDLRPAPAPVGESPAPRPAVRIA